MFISVSLSIQAYVCFFAADYTPCTTALYLFILNADAVWSRCKGWRMSRNAKKLVAYRLTLYALALYAPALCALAPCALDLYKPDLYKPDLYKPALYALALYALGPHAGIARHRSKIRRASRAIRKLAKHDDLPLYTLSLYGLALCGLTACALARYAVGDGDEW